MKKKQKENLKNTSHKNETIIRMSETIPAHKHSNKVLLKIKIKSRNYLPIANLKKTERV